MLKVIEVVAAIIIKDGQVFATQRGYGEAAAWLSTSTLRDVKWLPADEGLLDKISELIAR